MNNRIFNKDEQVLCEMRSFRVVEATSRHIYLRGEESDKSLTGPNPHEKLLPFNEFHASLGQQCLRIYERFIKREREKNETIENGRVVYAAIVQAWHKACTMEDPDLSSIYLERAVEQLTSLSQRERTLTNCARVIIDRSVLEACRTFHSYAKKPVAEGILIN